MSQPSEHFDVVVIGAGAGGLAAAIGAARCGASTLLVERYGFLGGAATHAQVLSYCGFYKDRAGVPEPTVLGVGEELLAGLRALGVPTTPVRSRSGNWIVMLDTEAVKLSCDRLAAASSAELRLHTQLVHAEAPDGRITQITLADAHRSYTVQANCFVDASGDATLAQRAGAAMRVDSAAGAHVQPSSLPIRIGGVPADVVIDRAYLTALIADYNARGGGQLTRPDGGVLVRLPVSGDLWSMVVDVQTDGLSGPDLTRAETESRALAWDFVQTLRQLPGCEHAYLVATGPQIGIRETRRPHTLADVSTDDGLTGRLRPHDGIARACWPMEVHEAPGRARFTPIGGDGHFDISHDALMPRDLRNLRLAGRVIGADAQSYGSIRVMGTGFATGQAAGVSAALHREGVAPPVADIRRTLAAQGALL